MADSRQIRVEVLTPEGKVFEGDLYQVSTRTVAGELGIRARHAPMLARLVPHELRLYESAEEFSAKGGRQFAAAEGWLEVFANRVVVLVEEARDPESLDGAALKERIAEARQRLEEAEEGSAAFEVAEQDLERAEAFLSVAER
jgi:F-type H+-transporting ATPase subunit epsilon